MAQKSLEERVDMLERRVEILEQLPERVTALEVQIVQLRDEMRAEFSATRAEARAGDEHVVRTLREEIRAGDEETRQFMRILHEEVIERIKALGDRP
jgi:predicted phage gp36 major capsid-like protein